MNGYVYRSASARRTVWHWAKRNEAGLAAACLSYPLAAATARIPLAVDIDDRCRGNGCRQRWDAWLRATVRTALLAEAAQQ